MSHELVTKKYVEAENPCWLTDFYCQWQEKHPKIEALIDWGVKGVPPSSEYLAWLKEGLRLSHFGIYLTQLAFPKACHKVDYPFIYVQAIDSAAVTVIKKGRPVEIIIGDKALLGKSDLYSDEDMVEVISTAVEEYSHWIRGHLIWTSPQKKARLRQEMLKYKRIMSKLVEIQEEIAQFNQVNWMSMVSDCECTHEEVQAYRDDLEQIIKTAYANYLATPDEFMGIIWQKKVCKLFYPWSKVAKRLQEEYDLAFGAIIQRGRVSSTPV